MSDTTFEAIRVLLDWQATKPGQTWEAIGPDGFACRIERVRPRSARHSGCPSPDVRRA